MTRDETFYERMRNAIEIARTDVALGPPPPPAADPTGVAPRPPSPPRDPAKPW